MEIKNLSKYSNAEKIVLAEQLWDSVSKENLEVSDDVKRELDIRIQNLEEGKTELYSWDEVKEYLEKKKDTLKKLDQFIEEHYGKVGTPKRDKLDKGFEKFKKRYLKKHNL